MYCPKCGYEQKCGCKSCKDKLNGIKPYKWVKDYFIRCTNCNLTMTSEWWQDLEYDYTFKYYKPLKNKK